MSSLWRPARILLTGSRTWTDRVRLETTLMDVWHDATQNGYTTILLTHGACPEGADAMGDEWAYANGAPQDPRPADWTGPCAPDSPDTGAGGVTGPTTARSPDTAATRSWSICSPNSL
jgi:hypothetical protein